MLLANAREEKFLKVFTKICFIVAYPHEAVLDDVGHNIFVSLFDFLPI